MMPLDVAVGVVDRQQGGQVSPKILFYDRTVYLFCGSLSECVLQVADNCAVTRCDFCQGPGGVVAVSSRSFGGALFDQETVFIRIYEKFKACS